ncbi:mediator of RNA polymerase II transcription subunit 23 isoform X3 [Harpia harpyja]|uniref:mediator of RNA polymerase II transcription subunit 23 isoform X5 n=1 Tax=Haliaeetus leucocephalus TaxID=52644 RepID=UPI00053CE70C|nr:PREDICTED: mediator of RNA polymerase II transcription subunit 23 isoform X5 [Haliaeetus leucocephalus]XP_052640327.1 mediator of RNA polymerase II transcription subunit 23 isoform X3 [Harpia harpyja]
MAIPMVPMETQLQSIFEEVVKTEVIEEAFPGMFMDTPEDERTKLISCLGAFRQFWSSLSQESHEQCVQWIVRFIHSQHSPKRISFLYDCLAMAVETGLLPPRMVCESLINSDTLEWERTQLWALTFKLVRKIIGGVDYKGVRDLLKVILEKILTIPNTVSSAVVQQLLAAREVVAYILERNACLLPAYFAVTEIRKLYPEGKLPHWLLGNLVSDFVDTFRPTARINSICGRCSLLPVVNNSGAMCNSWKLDPTTLRFPLKGLLPYDKDLFEPQTALLRYVLEQPYSRDMVCNMLGLNKQTLNIAQHKQRCPVLEDQLVDLVVYAMERSETEEKFDDGGTSQLLWQHLSSQLIFFVLFQFASFPHMVLSLHQKLAGRGLIKGRDHLMWVLLQFISGSIQKNALADFLPVMKLFDLLYPEKECIPVPDINKPQSTHAFAMTCIWIHLNRKAHSDNSKLQIPIPHSLKLHHEFLQQSLRNKSLQMNDYKIALLCNAYSTNSECFTLPMGVLVETIYGNGNMRIPLPGTNCMASGSITPLPMNLLDSLTVHAKMSLIHSIATRVIKLAHAKSSVALAPALVETYSRLLVYMEIESLGIKGFISQLLPTVFKSHAWGILHTLLEMFSYRMHHIQPHYRVQLLSHLHSLAAVPQTNQNQLHLCVESTALRLITALGSSEVQPQFTRFLSDPKTVLSAESEELNRALILTLARATHVTDFFTGSDSIQGTWCKDILQTIMSFTPHNWASHTLSCFPAPLQVFFKQNNVPQESRFNLKKNVEEEYRKWKSMTNENDIITHFSMQGSPPLFLCLLWKMLLETDHINQIGYRVLERIGARALVAHVRTFADFLVYEFSTSAGGQQLNKCIEILNDMVWKYNIVTLDRLILCLAMRSHEGNEAQVCYFIIQLLLLKPNDFRNRVSDFVKENSPEHWLQNDWHTKHMSYHKKYPEKLYFEGLAEQVNPPVQIQPQYLPIYFGNVCLRFLPVFDIVIHRFLELLPVSKSLETLLDHLGGLYKFHGKSPGPFPNCDWRFNEFPNPAAHALHVTCVELMALAVPGKDVGNALLNVVLKSQPLVPRENITAWMNAIGLIITALPEPYWIVLHDRIVSVINSPSLTSETEWVGYPFQLFDFTACHQSYSEMSCSYTLALAHAVWHHSSIGQLSLIPKFLTEVLIPIVKTEFQLLYVYHLVGPFLQRFQQERTRCMIEIGVAFYEMLLNADRYSSHLNYMDPICDFLYHMKYMFTGDSVKDQVEKIICNLRPALKLRLRFITHISKMEPAAVPQQPLNNGSPAQQPSQVPVNVALPVTQ